MNGHAYDPELGRMLSADPYVQFPTYSQSFNRYSACAFQAGILFHDVPGDGFNLDYIAIGPGGIYAIEIKTWSKPSKGRPRITVDAQGISLAGYAPNRDPLVQGVAQARWLSDLLTKSTGRHLTLQPAILFPGWYIEASRGRSARPWDLEPKAFPKFLEREPVSLLEDEVHLASFHLSRYIRSESLCASRTL